EQCCLPCREAAGLEDVLRLEPTDIAPEHCRMSEVGAKRLARVPVMVERDSDAIACSLDAKVEAPRSAEQADGRQLRHAPLSSRLVRRATPHHGEHPRRGYETR